MTRTRTKKTKTQTQRERISDVIRLEESSADFLANPQRRELFKSFLVGYESQFTTLDEAGRSALMDAYEGATAILLYAPPTLLPQLIALSTYALLGIQLSTEQEESFQTLLTHLGKQCLEESPRNSWFAIAPYGSIVKVEYGYEISSVGTKNDKARLWNSGADHPLEEATYPDPDSALTALWHMNKACLTKAV